MPLRKLKMHDFAHSLAHFAVLAARHPLQRPTRLVPLSMAPLDALRCLQDEGFFFKRTQQGRPCEIGVRS